MHRLISWTLFLLLLKPSRDFTFIFALIDQLSLTGVPAVSRVTFVQWPLPEHVM